jgi:YidC/Oxa1 family membrane protein insertase
LTAVRFNSTTPSAATAPLSTPAAAAVPPSTPASLLDNLDAPPTGLENVDAASITEHAPNTMGYLHSLGIDFGWGTTSIIQTLVESLHVCTGLPWWGTVMASVFIIRAAQFPGYCKMSSMTARMKEINPVVAPIALKMKEAQKRSDMQAMVQFKQEMDNMFKMAGVNRAWLIYPFTQIPVFYGFYKILRGMAETPVPALQQESLLWFNDLSAADPTMVLPLLASSFIGVQIALGGETGASPMAKSMKTALMFGLPALSFGITYGWPSVLGWYILCNSSAGLVQTLLLRNETFRAKAGLYPLAVGGTPNPFAPRPGSLSALNVLDSKTIDVTPNSKRQVGTKGGLLDRLTGGEDDPNSAWSLKKLKESVCTL